MDKVDDSLQATLQIFDNQTYQFIGGVYGNKFEKKGQTYVLNFKHLGNNIKAEHAEVEIMLHNIDTYPGSTSVFLDDFSIAVSSTENIIRISGKDRFKTSFAMAEQLRNTLNIEQFDSVIFASGRDFADALAGSALAAQKCAPVLMVDSKKDNLDDIKEYLNQVLKPDGTVYVLGGASAVPARAEELFDNIKRLSGKTRYETNLEILKELNVHNGTLLVANAKNFADSLSASATGLPILLVGNQLNDSQKEFLKTGSWQFAILGGEAAVSQEVETALQAYGTVERIKGKTRYETSIEIARRYFDKPETAVLAYGKNYPDGLSAGPLSYVLKAPLILTESKNIISAMNYVKSQNIRTGIICGGTSLITDEAVNDVFSLLK